MFREWAIHSGKYGDGSDVTTWKINFRCALNGLKDIIERRDLEEPDCRVYQMLPSSTTGGCGQREGIVFDYNLSLSLSLLSLSLSLSGRRRKRRRVFYQPDSASFQGSESRPRIDLASPVTTPTYPITPTTGWKFFEPEILLLEHFTFFSSVHTNTNSSHRYRGNAGSSPIGCLANHTPNNAHHYITVWTASGA